MSRSKRKSTNRSTRHRLRYTRRRAIGFLAALLVTAALILADRTGVFGRRPAPKPDPYRPTAAAIKRNNAADLKTYHRASFRVLKVVDGDTLDVDIRDAVAGYKTTRIRLWGVDTPETVKPNTPTEHFGPQAARFTKNFCMGKTVRLELVKDRNTRCKYGRLLAYVFVPTSGEGTNEACLNAELIGRGYGYSDPRYPHPRKKEFGELQRQARENRAGLWAGAGASDLPHYYQRKIKLGQ